MPIYADIIIDKLAYIHGLSPPAPHGTDQFWHEISVYLLSIRFVQRNHKIDSFLPKQQFIINGLLKIDFESEAIWLRDYLDELRAPIVFSHGKLRENQVYLREHAKNDNKISFLDIGWGK